MSQIFKTIHRFGTARKREWNLREPDWGGRGRLHQTNGPAIEYSDGRKEWWVLGCYIAREYRGRRSRRAPCRRRGIACWMSRSGSLV